MQQNIGVNFAKLQLIMHYLFIYLAHVSMLGQLLQIFISVHDQQVHKCESTNQTVITTRISMLISTITPALMSTKKQKRKRKENYNHPSHQPNSPWLQNSTGTILRALRPCRFRRALDELLAVRSSWLAACP